MAGLACARRLAERGVAVRLLEKSRGVGGRCATRTVHGVRVDHGLAFYHGDDAGFLAALESVDADPPFAWPRRIEGRGAPCQPSAFAARQRQLAFAGGVSVFPKQLARGLTVEFETRVGRIERSSGRLRLVAGDDRRFATRTVVLTPPAGQTLDLLETLDDPSRTLQSAAALLAGVSTVRCLTLLAGYAPGTEGPGWDVAYPEGSDILQLISHDSTKRPDDATPVLVLQGRPGWSAARWDEPPEAWTGALLDAARETCGDWVTRPVWTDIQRWRYARLTGGDGMTAPLLLDAGDGCRIGIAGEAAAAGGGVQAAWRSGRMLADRLIEEQRGET